MSDQVRTIRLYGVLGARFGRVHHLAVESPAEAIRALGSQLPGFEAFLTQSKDNGLAYAVFLGKRNIGKDMLRMPSGHEDIRIAPIIIGSKNGGVFQIILGAALVIIGTVASPFTGGASLALVPIGWSMVIGGVIQLLTPVPKQKGTKDSPGNESSFTFNGPINTQAQGNAVSILYGEMIIGSAVISAGIKPVDVFISHQGHGGGGFRWHDEWVPVEP